MLNSLLLLVARILIAALFVPAGISTLSNITVTAGYFAGLGFPLPTIVALGVGLFELVGGMLVLVGFQSRIVPVLLAAFALAAGFIGHYGQGGGDAAMAYMHQQALMKDIATAGGLLALSVAGSGAISLDRMLLRQPI
ncbi:putative oxidoreductase [Aminobacter lissarensis]|uniref:Oxidoreductase n=1 Tax=Aminobacter carboxidus TaxID=376165 RepID=A0A8E1WET5_9HYPH|nr:DoxX family protein [Aminobacter lissarensis]MBB6466220.1 putative oxidoreductase [Aminobacter lissarensis]